MFVGKGKRNASCPCWQSLGNFLKPECGGLNSWRAHHSLHQLGSPTSNNKMMNLHLVGDPVSFKNVLVSKVAVEVTMLSTTGPGPSVSVTSQHGGRTTQKKMNLHFGAVVFVLLNKAECWWWWRIQQLILCLLATTALTRTSNPKEKRFPSF